MKTHDKEVFTNMRVVLDGARFENCMFESCELVYGGGPLSFNKNLVNNCSFAFADSAARTINFMKGMYQDAPELIEATIREIRGGSPR
jgi:hypothetical protein